MAEGDQFLVRDTRMPGHFWADNEVYDQFAPELGAHAFAVYLALCRTAINGTGECRIAMSRIAYQLAISKATVHEALGKIVGAGLAQLVEPGGPRRTALYLLADVKSLVDPHLAQLRLASVRLPNAQRSPTERSVRPEASNPNAAFAHRTPYKEDKTFTRLKTNTPPTPPAGGLTNRQLANLSKELDRMKEAAVGSHAPYEDRVKRAAAKLLLPEDLALKAVFGPAGREVLQGND